MCVDNSHRLNKFQLHPQSQIQQYFNKMLGRVLRSWGRVWVNQLSWKMAYQPSAIVSILQKASNFSEYLQICVQEQNNITPNDLFESVTFLYNFKNIKIDYSTSTANFQIFWQILLNIDSKSLNFKNLVGFLAMFSYLQRSVGKTLPFVKAKQIVQAIRLLLENQQKKQLVLLINCHNFLTERLVFNHSKRFIWKITGQIYDQVVQKGVQNLSLSLFGTLLGSLARYGIDCRLQQIRLRNLLLGFLGQNFGSYSYSFLAKMINFLNCFENYSWRQQQKEILRKIIEYLLINLEDFDEKAIFSILSVKNLQIISLQKIISQIAANTIRQITDEGDCSFTPSLAANILKLVLNNVYIKSDEKGLTNEKILTFLLKNMQIAMNEKKQQEYYRINNAFQIFLTKNYFIKYSLRAKIQKSLQIFAPRFNELDYFLLANQNIEIQPYYSEYLKQISSEQNIFPQKLQCILATIHLLQRKGKINQLLQQYFVTINQKLKNTPQELFLFFQKKILFKSPLKIIYIKYYHKNMGITILQNVIQKIAAFQIQSQKSIKRFVVYCILFLDTRSFNEIFTRISPAINFITLTGIYTQIINDLTSFLDSHVLASLFELLNRFVEDKSTQKMIFLRKSQYLVKLMYNKMLRDSSLPLKPMLLFMTKVLNQYLLGEKQFEELVDVFLRMACINYSFVQQNTQYKLFVLFLLNNQILFNNRQNIYRLFLQGAKKLGVLEQKHLGPQFTQYIEKSEKQNIIFLKHNNDMTQIKSPLSIIELIAIVSNRNFQKRTEFEKPLLQEIKKIKNFFNLSMILFYLSWKTPMGKTIFECILNIFEERKQTYLIELTLPFLRAFSLHNAQSSKLGKNAINNLFKQIIRKHRFLTLETHFTILEHFCSFKVSNIDEYGDKILSRFYVHAIDKSIHSKFLVRLMMCNYSFQNFKQRMFLSHAVYFETVVVCLALENKIDSKIIEEVLNRTLIKYQQKKETQHRFDTNLVKSQHFQYALSKYLPKMANFDFTKFKSLEPLKLLQPSQSIVEALTAISEETKLPLELITYPELENPLYKIKNCLFVPIQPNFQFRGQLLNNLTCRILSHRYNWGDCKIILFKSKMISKHYLLQQVSKKTDILTPQILKKLHLMPSSDSTYLQKETD